jgi:hypothetical protein
MLNTMHIRRALEMAGVFGQPELLAFEFHRFAALRLMAIALACPVSQIGKKGSVAVLTEFGLPGLGHGAMSLQDLRSVV